jgi:hypothetical protein
VAGQAITLALLAPELWVKSKWFMSFKAFRPEHSKYPFISTDKKIKYFTIKYCIYATIYYISRIIYKKDII